MKKTAFTLIALTLSAVAFCQPALVSKVWVADQGNGTYRNPILHADYSDPDAIRVGDDYYMTASSFEDAPGLPILHSKDLVNWRLIGHALPSWYLPPILASPAMARAYGHRPCATIMFFFSFIPPTPILVFTFPPPPPPPAPGAARCWW